MDDDTTTIAPSAETNATTPSAKDETTEAGAATEQAAPPRSFTQEQVNEMMRARLTRSHQRFFDRYGVKDLAGLDALIGRAQSFDLMKGKIDALAADNGALAERVAFMSNNIRPERYDDVRAYFKGKGLAFGEGRLAEELKAHPEWAAAAKGPAPTTTIRVLGADATLPPREDERRAAEGLLGVRFRR